MNISEYIADSEEQQKMSMENMLANTRVAIPGIVVSVNSQNQTALIQPALKESINGESIQLPQLLDVPIQFPRAGGYCLTLPVKAGDECLVVFADMCIDGWWQSGGIQAQAEKRRHDLSDAIAVMGITSVPKAVSNYSGNTLQIRNENGEAYLEISDNTITIKADNLIFDIKNNITAITPTTSFNGNVSTTGSFTGQGAFISDGNVKLQGSMEINGSLNTPFAVIGGIDFGGHVHGGILKGSDKTEIPSQKKG